MIEHVWSVLCSHSVIDRESNNISLFEVIEKISGIAPVNAEGVVPIQLELVSLWSRENLEEPESGEARIIFLAPDGTEIGSPIPYAVDMSEYARTRHRSRINGIPIRGSGKYTFQTEIRKNDDSEPVSRVSLEIAIQVHEETT